MALDILRGLTLAGMILVNNPGSWENIYTPLEHAPFCGCTLADLVFPFFMFVMGFSIPLSMRKYDFRLSGKSVKKILRRTLLLFLIGIAFNLVFSLAGGFRLLGVLQRLAVCYGLTAVLILTLKPKRFPWIICILLMGYWCLLRFGGDGYEFSETNIVSRLDFLLLGPSLMGKDNGIFFDSEGFISTLPALAHVMIGAWLSYVIGSEKFGKGLSAENLLKKKVKLLTAAGVISLVAAVALILTGDALCKKLWTPSFVFLTTGLAELLLAGFIGVVDIKHYGKGWGMAFRVFGVNPLIMYVIAMLLEIIVNVTGVTVLVYGVLNAMLPPCMASLCYAVLFVFVNWCIAYFFYWKNIYIKL